MGRHSDNICPRSALCAQTNNVAQWVENGSVIINVDQIYLHIGYRAQSTLQRKQKALLLYPHMH